jgi:hypothetical protein
MAMQKIKFSADADLLDQAEQIAKEKGHYAGGRSSAMAKGLGKRQVEAHSREAEEENCRQIHDGLNPSAPFVDATT